MASFNSQEEKKSREEKWPESKEKPGLKIEKHNSLTHPEDFYLRPESLSMVESETGENKLEKIKNKMGEIVKVKKALAEEEVFLPYFYQTKGKEHQLYLKSADGIQQYTFRPDLFGFYLSEKQEKENVFIKKAFSKPVFQYWTIDHWQDYKVVLPLSFELKEFEDYLILLVSFDLLAEKGLSQATKGELEFKLGFDGENYINKLTFRLEENENLNRLVWENDLLTGDKNCSTEEDKATIYCQDLFIDWSDFKETRALVDYKKDEGLIKIYFHEDGQRGSLEIDPTLSVTTAADTVNISVSGEFEIELDRTKGGIIDSWYDLENDAAKADQLADSTDGLFDFYGLVSGSTRRISDSTSTTQEILEISQTRTVIRYSGNLGAANYNYVLTYTISAAGLVNILLEITNNTGGTITWTAQRAEITIDSTTNHSADGDGVASDGDAMLPGKNNWVKWVGDGTTEKDAAVLYYYTGFDYNEYYVSGTKVALERDTSETQANGNTLTRIFKLQLRPDTDDLGTNETVPDAYAVDFRIPESFPGGLAAGQGWFDSVEKSTQESLDWTDEFTGQNARWEWDYSEGTGYHNLTSQEGYSVVESGITEDSSSSSYSDCSFHEDSQSHNTGVFEARLRCTDDNTGSGSGHGTRGWGFWDVINWTDPATFDLAWFWSASPESDAFLQGYRVMFYRGGNLLINEPIATDMTDWHTYRVEMLSSTGTRFFVDGEEIAHHTLLPNQIQRIETWIDNYRIYFDGGVMQAEYLDAEMDQIYYIDWVKYYSSPSDYFNEEEGSYCLEGTMSPSSFAEWDMDGGTHTRYNPFFKIRGWRSYSEPSSVTLEGAGLVDGTNYNMDIAPFSEAWIYDSDGSGYKKLADGGDVDDADEYLNDASNDNDFGVTYTFNANTDYIYLGSHDQFTGVNLDLATAGAGTAALQWQYCSANAAVNSACDTWTNLSVTDTDSGAYNLKTSGNFYFADPANWARAQVNSGRTLWWIRAYVTSGSYSTYPIENTIRTDIVLLQYLSNISSDNQTFVVVPENLWPFLVVIPFIHKLARKKRKRADKIYKTLT